MATCLRYRYLTVSLFDKADHDPASGGVLFLKMSAIVSGGPWAYFFVYVVSKDGVINRCVS